ncbi:hypothetical protein TrST_g6724 [Triparma strigata]|uniref:Ubiquitin-like protease family profile domain-containing protein n=1 Tax=Triparma strigata TaxID=1606541 RepID=A0A9W7C029_9STRA|nr:hypothetical protein TrST_g6724 [Triparma strigata]
MPSTNGAAYDSDEVSFGLTNHETACFDSMSFSGSPSKTPPKAKKTKKKFIPEGKKSIKNKYEAAYDNGASNALGMMGKNGQKKSKSKHFKSNTNPIELLATNQNKQRSKVRSKSSNSDDASQLKFKNVPPDRGSKRSTADRALDSADMSQSSSPSTYKPPKRKKSNKSFGSEKKRHSAGGVLGLGAFAQFNDVWKSREEPALEKGEWLTEISPSKVWKSGERMQRSPSSKKPTSSKKFKNNTSKDDVDSDSDDYRPTTSLALHKFSERSPSLRSSRRNSFPTHLNHSTNETAIDLCSDSDNVPESPGSQIMSLAVKCEGAYIGKKLIGADRKVQFKLKFGPCPMMKLVYSTSPDGSKVHLFSMNSSEALSTVRYSVEDCFITFRWTVDELSNLKEIRNSYEQEEWEGETDPKKKDWKIWRKGFITIVPKENNFENFREAIKEAQEKWPIFATMLKGSEVTDEEEIELHTRNLKKKVKTEDKIAFIYPPRTEEKEEDDDELVLDDAGGIGKGKERVTIMETDLERLESGVWLNDNLVDLWFKMVRENDSQVQNVLEAEPESDSEMEVFSQEEEDNRKEREKQRRGKKDKDVDPRDKSLGSSSESDDDDIFTKTNTSTNTATSSSPALSNVSTAASSTATVPDNLHRSTYHVFTSHFYTTLNNSKYEGVKSWVKDIKSFLNMKYVFVPICKDMHWSLCVIVNPGAYFNEKGVDEEKVKRAEKILCGGGGGDLDEAVENDENEEEEEKAPGSCILFFDSLKFHASKGIHNNIRMWMGNMMQDQLPNTEESDELLKKIFKKNSKIFPILEPGGIPYQTNGCDCGVFTSLYFNAVRDLAPNLDCSLKWIKNFKRQKVFRHSFDFNQSNGVPEWRERMKIVCGDFMTEYGKRKV